MPRDLRLGWQTIALLYQLDRSAFLVATATSVIQSVVYPLLLVVVWQGLSLLTTASPTADRTAQRAIALLGGFFGLLALQSVLRIVNETATSILQAESAQDINGRIMDKMPEVPYHLFEDNDFQARYGLLISQASHRPGMLVEAFVGGLSSLAAAIAVAVTLFALAPMVDAFLLVLIPLSVAETRFHGRIIELQTSSAPRLFRMTYLVQRSIDAAWQRDIRVHRSTVLNEEYRVLARGYMTDLRSVLRRYQWVRLAVGLGTALATSLALAAVFRVVSQSPAGLTEAAVLLPALFMGLSQARSFSASWGVLTECLGYLAQLFAFLNQSFGEPSVGVRRARPRVAATA
jgi:ABC-type multidrug transport system fused ATPase/permease subunit